MFDSIDAATKKTAAQLSIGAGTALLLYNKFERPSEPMGLSLALIGGGLVVLALTASEGTGSSWVSGPQEEKDLAAIKAEDCKLHWMPWVLGGTAALLVARLVLL